MEQCTRFPYAKRKTQQKNNCFPLRCGKARPRGRERGREKEQKRLNEMEEKRLKRTLEKMPRKITYDDSPESPFNEPAALSPSLTHTMNDCRSVWPLLYKLFRLLDRSFFSNSQIPFSTLLVFVRALEHLFRIARAEMQKKDTNKKNTLIHTHTHEQSDGRAKLKVSLQAI